MCCNVHRLPGLLAGVSYHMHHKAQQLHAAWITKLEPKYPRGRLKSGNSNNIPFFDLSKGRMPSTIINKNVFFKSSQCMCTS